MSGLRGKVVYPGGQVEASSLDLEDVEERLKRGESLTIDEQRDLLSALKLEMDRVKYADEYINGAKAGLSESDPK